MDTIELNEDPFLSADDIESYDAENHIFHLNKSRDSLGLPYYPPVNGHMFVIVANGERIYCGFLWAGYSSTPCHWVVIMTGGFPEFQIKIELGYPGEFDFQGTDPRNNPIILDALNKNGLLTGISERRGESLSMYPNPTNGVLNVSGLRTTKNVSLSVYNEVGKLKYKSALTGSQVDISNHPSGIYFIQLFEDKKLSGTYKIIKQ